MLIYSGFLEAGLENIKKKLDSRFYVKDKVKLSLNFIDDKMERKYGGKPTILHSWKNIEKDIEKALGEKRSGKTPLSQEKIDDLFHDAIDDREDDATDRIRQIFHKKYGKPSPDNKWPEEVTEQLNDEIEKAKEKLSRNQIQRGINSIFHEKMLLPLAQLKQEFKDRRIESKYLHGNTKEAYYEALRDYIEITGDISKTKRKDDKERFNDPHSGVDIMLISKAGGVALDLKGVRKVIMLESQWNRAGEDQVKGRATRFKSHEGLPLSKRNVEVIHLILTKPGGPFEANSANMHMLDELGIDLTSFKEPYHRLFTVDASGIKHPDPYYSADVAKLLMTIIKDAINNKFKTDLLKLNIDDC